jgi:hypothetical protein
VIGSSTRVTPARLPIVWPALQCRGGLVWFVLTAAASVLGAVVVARAAAPATASGEPSARPPVIRYADGAPPAFSGGFDEPSCHGCHFHEAVNADGGRVTLTGVPERYVDGERYSLTVTLARPGMVIGGFQLTARGEQGGAQAGTLQAGSGEEARVKIERPVAVEYAGQRRAGARPVVGDALRWTLEWTAPARTAGPVLFHVAANAADNDETVSGDFVYTAVTRAAPANP